MAPCPLLKDISGRNHLHSVTGKMLIENLLHARNTAVIVVNKGNSSPGVTFNGRKRQEKNKIISDTSNTDKNLDLRMPEGRMRLGDYFSRNGQESWSEKIIFQTKIWEDDFGRGSS